MNKPILALSNVSKTFQSEADSISILQNLDLTIEQPAKIAVVGELRKKYVFEYCRRFGTG